MNSLEKIKKPLKENKGILINKFHVKRIGIFGSYVRGEQKNNSDIDLLVEFKKSVGLFEFMDLEKYLTGLVGVRVDLVSKKALKPYIGRHVLKEVVYL